MTNEEIKRILLSLEATETDFEVIQTGKESRKANGLYNPCTREILIHSKNFANDNQLVYTAIHEYSHHLVTESRLAAGLPLKEKSHDTEFWAKMDDLVETAVARGVYKRSHSAEMQALIKKAKELDEQIARLQGELGEALSEIQRLSKEEGGRFEDIASHELKMKDATMKKCCRIAAADTSGFGQDETAAIATSHSTEEAATMKTRLRSGKTVSQTARDLNEKRETPPEQRLLKEKERIQKTISALEQRLDAIEAILDAAAAAA